MKIQVRGFYYACNPDLNAFVVYAVNSDESFINRVDTTESEMWEILTYLLEHPHYMVMHYGVDVFGGGLKQERILRFDCVYAPTLKAQQIAEINQYFEWSNQL